MEDDLARLVWRRSLVRVVQPADDDRGVHVALEERDDNEVVHSGDGREAHHPDRDRHIRQHHTAVAELNGHRVVPAIAGADLCHPAGGGDGPRGGLVPGDAADAVVESARHSRLPSAPRTAPSRSPPLAPASTPSRIDSPPRSGSIRWVTRVSSQFVPERSSGRSWISTTIPGLRWTRRKQRARIRVAEAAARSLRAFVAVVAAFGVRRADAGNQTASLP